MDRLIDLCSKPYDPETWHEESNSAFKEIFGSITGRYPDTATKEIQFRTPKMVDSDKNVPFSAMIPASEPQSGGYGGMSFVIFPIQNGPPLIAMGVGTQGLSPDSHILGKPGHSRKVNAICAWLNKDFGEGKIIAWAKHDAVRIDKDVPDNIKAEFPEYSEVFKKYGKVIYGFCVGNKKVLETALKVFIDLNFEERGHSPLARALESFNELKNKYFAYLMPSISSEYVLKLLKSRKYVIIQGPPGTGKTRLSQILLEQNYANNGTSIQFHPNTTYESFIGGLFPDTDNVSNLGLSFHLKKGSLLEAVVAAKKDDKDYLLVIDEINRADLSKVLGEAIFCLEPYDKRKITLSYKFDEIGKELSIPSNLHILGTMNSADRSIAILDVAIRRRFAFINLWPDITIIKERGTELTLDLFKKLLSIFIEYANDEAFVLIPGQSYFLKYDGVDEKAYLKTNLVPLLNEYLDQGYVSNFSDAIHSYIQEIDSL